MKLPPKKKMKKNSKTKLVTSTSPWFHLVVSMAEKIKCAVLWRPIWNILRIWKELETSTRCTTLEDSWEKVHSEQLENAQVWLLIKITLSKSLTEIR